MWSYLRRSRIRSSLSAGHITQQSLALVILFTVFAIPSAIVIASAQTVSEDGNNNDNEIDLPDGFVPTGPVGPVGIVNELEKAH